MSLSPPHRIRFGIFEVDMRSGEVLRRGHRIELQEQPFQALVMLLERPGEPVSREELSRRLWPRNTFVDFERGLNKAINKLRSALKDSAEKPRYIETLPQRGYRFIAPIEPLVQVGNHFRLQNSTEIESLAVLPLQNLSGDPGQEYFSDGMTEELISAVAQIAPLRVISRTSVMAYKGSGKSVAEIARDLNVDAVVEGSVVRSNQKVRVIAQLILAREDRHLWAGRYERDLRDILHLRAEVAESIAAQIHKVVDPVYRHAARPREVHPEAYEACLKGNYFRDKMTPAELIKSTEFFDRAIRLDPTYARAFGDLARSYFYLGLFGVGPPSENFSRARLNATKALELDEATASAHIALAAVHVFYDWDWESAEREAWRAVELCPGEPVSHAHFADYLSLRGRHDEAIATYRRVIELDPISRVHRGHFGLIFYRARRYAESIEQCQAALDIDPDYVNAHWFTALSLEQTEGATQAIAKLERAVALSPAPHFRALLGRAYGLAGEPGKASGILEELQALTKHMYVSPFDLAVVYCGLGDQDATFNLLEQAYEQRVFRIIELMMPMFDDLRPDPRWQSLVRRARRQV
ncbi:MAG TPA: winged helix-turn-helix domain-containing protein [Acidobacteriaceae bacterium]